MTKPNLHYQKLKGARTLQTWTYLDIERALEATIEDNGICKVLGDAGVGKSYCTETILLKAKRRYLRVVATSGPTPARMGEKTVAGFGRTPQGNRFRLEDICREILVKSFVLAIDDAQVLPPSTIDFLRQLHDDPETEFSLLLLGDPAFENRLIHDRQLSSRLTVSVDAYPVADDEIVDTMRRFHPVFQNAPEHLLVRIRDECTGGFMRDWAIFITHSKREMRKAGVKELTEEVVNAVIYLMGKRI